MNNTRYTVIIDENISFAGILKGCRISIHKLRIRWASGRHLDCQSHPLEIHMNSSEFHKEYEVKP